MTSPLLPIELLYVVDTHALIWYLIGDKKLSQRALSIFMAAEQGQTQLLVPTIVLAELYYANAKNKWFADYAVIYKALLKKPYLKFIPFDHQHVLEFQRDQTIPEMHDRIIAGVARRLGAPLITSDPLIMASQLVTTEW
jgi:PIN domain nuclease of toxin-antitoxin system